MYSLQLVALQCVHVLRQLCQGFYTILLHFISNSPQVTKCLVQRFPKTSTDLPFLLGHDLPFDPFISLFHFKRFLTQFLCVLASTSGLLFILRSILCWQMLKKFQTSALFYYVIQSSLLCPTQCQSLLSVTICHYIILTKLSSSLV